MIGLSAIRHSAFSIRHSALRRTLPKDYTPGSWRVRREFLRVPDAFPPPPFQDAEAAGSAVARVVKALGLPEADPAALTLQEEEVADARWFSLEEVAAMIGDGRFVDYPLEGIRKVFSLAAE